MLALLFNSPFAVPPSANFGGGGGFFPSPAVMLRILQAYFTSVYHFYVADFPYFLHEREFVQLKLEIRNS